MGNLLAVGVPPLPMCRTEITFRVATMADLPFLDALQKKHSKALGYFPTKQFEGYIEMGAVLVAEEKVEDRGWKIEDSAAADGPALSSTLYPLSSPAKLGYVISRDRYLKRDELGVIYQLCVVPGVQRKLIGASLVKEVFERSAYGCRLYCCWCAQDLAANYFWESMGFLPIAFRAGSDRKRRVHIFWQRRINDGDTGEGATPYWYPCQTNAGAIREDRLVVPIPPGVHWKDVQAVTVPGVARADCSPQVRPCLPGKKKDMGETPMRRKPAATIASGGLFFAAAAAPAKPAKAKVKVKVKVTIDPKLVAAARELRDRYLEQLGDGRILPPAANGKYEVGRALEDNVIPMSGTFAQIQPTPPLAPTPALPAPKAA